MLADRGRRLQLRGRVLAGVLAITIVAFAAFDAVAVTELHKYLVGRVDSTLNTVLDLGSRHLNRLVLEADAGRRGPVLQAGLGTYDYLAFVPDSGPTVVLDAAAGVKPELPADLPTLAARRQAQTVSVVNGEGQVRLQARHVDGGVLAATASLEEVHSTTAKLRRIVIIGSGLAVLLIALGVILVVRRGLRPLESMAAEADRINAGDLPSRVGPDDPASEVGRLAAALNGMLARIEADIQQREADQELMRRFFADASHELRNPLASLRANADLYQQGALAERAQVDEAMRRIRLEAERMSRLVDDMLRLARLDQHPEQQQDTVDLTDLLQGCVNYARVTDPERTWNTDISRALTTTGDAELIRRAVDNLIANVRTHTPPGTTATLTAIRKDASVEIEVSDNGPGVPADRVDRIFDRFYRSNTHSPRSGSGLGLAIVTEIATVHHGQVTATIHHPHGLRVTLTLAAPRPGGQFTSNSNTNPAPSDALLLS